MNKDILDHMKKSRGVAFDQITEDNIREVVFLYDDGHFCGYIGIPEESDFNKMKIHEADQAFSCHGGVTYCESYLPPSTGISNDEKRRWIGFDCAEKHDGRDWELVREVYGEAAGARAKKLAEELHMGSLRMDFDAVLNEVEEMAEQLREMEHIPHKPKESMEMGSIGLNLIAEVTLKSGRTIKENVPYDMAEDVGHSFNVDTIKEYLEKNVGIPVITDIKVFVPIEVPFDMALIAMDKEDKLDIDQVWEEIDECPDSVVIDIPLEHMKNFYENNVITDEMWAEGEDVRMSRWLSEEYTLDDTRDLISYVQIKEPDFDVAKALGDDRAIVEEYLNEFSKEKGEMELQ